MCDSLLAFFEEMTQYEFKSQIALIKIIYLHYKTDNVYEQIKQRLAMKKTVSTEIYLLDNS